MSKNDTPFRTQAQATGTPDSWDPRSHHHFPLIAMRTFGELVTIVKVVTSRIYHHTAWYLGRTPLLSRFVVNGSEIQPKSYLWIFSQVGARILNDSGSKWFSPHPKHSQDEPLGWRKKILELLCTVFLIHNCITFLLMPKQVSTNSAAWNNTNVWSHSFCRSEVQLNLIGSSV